MSEYTEETSRKELFAIAKGLGKKPPFNAKKDQLRRIIDGTEDAPAKTGRRKKKRIPLGSYRSKLGVEQYNIPKDKVVRWINDKAGRIHRSIEGGYEHWMSDIPTGEEPLREKGVGGKVSAIVGSEDDGRPIRAYLMVIDKELYEEDQADKLAELDELDAAIQGGEIESKEGDGKYVPSRGIKISRNN